MFTCSALFLKQEAELLSISSLMAVYTTRVQERFPLSTHKFYFLLFKFFVNIYLEIEIVLWHKYSWEELTVIPYEQFNGFSISISGSILPIKGFQVMSCVPWRIF